MVIHTASTDLIILHKIGKMNSNKRDVIKLGLAQIAPIWLNKAKTQDKLILYMEQAKKENCDLVIFGEAILPGYPFWVELTDGAKFNSSIQKEIWAHYYEQAINIPAGDLKLIQECAKKLNIQVIFGSIERAMDRGGHSLYCSLIYIDNLGELKNVHRKLMPTYEERLVWSQGDGHGLQVFPFEKFTLGALNCWENWMPLARTALYAQGEDLHVSIWPGNIRNTENLTRFIAEESRSFVISVCGIFRSSDVNDEVPHADLIKENCPDFCGNGGSCIAGPDGQWIIEPQVGSEGLYCAEIDHKQVRRERQNFDPVGHYSRPDVLQIKVNNSRQNTLVDFKPS